MPDSKAQDPSTLHDAVAHLKRVEAAALGEFVAAVTTEEDGFDNHPDEPYWLAKATGARVAASVVLAAFGWTPDDLLAEFRKAWGNASRGRNRERGEECWQNEPGAGFGAATNDA